jgi:hypothetical protein
MTTRVRPPFPFADKNPRRPLELPQLPGQLKAMPVRRSQVVLYNNDRAVNTWNPLCADLILWYVIHQPQQQAHIKFQRWIQEKVLQKPAQRVQNTLGA